MKTPLALRIDVPSGRHACTGIPVLTDILRRHRIEASFVVSMGPDWLGRSLVQACPHILRQLGDEGFEVGVHGWKTREWTRRIEQADASWSEVQLKRMRDAFEQVFATPPKLHAAPGWRTNPHALRLTQRLNFSYASDCRGRHPFLPVWNGEIVRCPQIPTTLPTLEELADSKRPDPAVLRDKLLALSASRPVVGHVFSLSLKPDIAKRAELIESLLGGWIEQGYEIMSIGALAGRLVTDKLPRHELVVSQVPGRRDNVLLQGDEFLSAWRETP